MKPQLIKQASMTFQLINRFDKILSHIQKKHVCQLSFEGGSLYHYRYDLTPEQVQKIKAMLKEDKMILRKELENL